MFRHWGPCQLNLELNFFLYIPKSVVPGFNFISCIHDLFIWLVIPSKTLPHSSTVKTLNGCYTTWDLAVTHPSLLQSPVWLSLVVPGGIRPKSWGEFPGGSWSKLLQPLVWKVGPWNFLWPWMTTQGVGWHPFTTDRILKKRGTNFCSAQ